MFIDPPVACDAVYAFHGSACVCVHACVTHYALSISKFTGWAGGLSAMWPQQGTEATRQTRLGLIRKNRIDRTEQCIR